MVPARPQLSARAPEGRPSNRSRGYNRRCRAETNSEHRHSVSERQLELVACARRKKLRQALETVTRAVAGSVAMQQDWNRGETRQGDSQGEEGDEF